MKQFINILGGEKSVKAIGLVLNCSISFLNFALLILIGTIHIHSVAKLLMTKGFSSQILEFLVWSCVAMESSVPLMTVKYLGWRCQLYSTTSLCFYDLKADQAGEEFARRGLAKVCISNFFYFHSKKESFRLVRE